MMYRKLTFALLFMLAAGSSAYAQPRLVLPLDTMVVTKHTVTIGGALVPYTAVTGTQPVWDEAGQPIASLNYTYYSRSDVKKQDERPLVLSFNGGPGSASVWMQLAYTGPRLLKIDDEGYPVQP